MAGTTYSVISEEEQKKILAKYTPEQIERVRTLRSGYMTTSNYDFENNPLGYNEHTLSIIRYYNIVYDENMFIDIEKSPEYAKYMDNIGSRIRDKIAICNYLGIKCDDLGGF